MAIRELRIHGVGGSPGERLLGLTSPDQAVVVGEGRGTVFLARRDRRELEGYDWGGLTSGSSWQPLWLLLLPFTLVNVAGWAHAPFGQLSPTRRRVFRTLVHVSGAALTVAWVLWVAIIAVELLGVGWLGPLVERPVVGAAAGVVVTLAATGLLWKVAASSRSRSVAIPPAATTAGQGVGTGAWAPAEDLTDPSFFTHEASMSERLSFHLGLALATIVTVVLVTQQRWGAPQLRLGELFVPVGAAQIGLILALAVVCGLPRGSRRDGGSRDSRNWQLRILPAAAVTMAVALTNASFAGLALLVAPLAGDPAEVTGPELALIDGFVVVAAVWLAVVVAWVLRRRRRGDADDLPSRTSGPGEELDGVDPAWRRRVAALRGLAAACHDATRTLSWFAVLFGGVAGWLVAHRTDPTGPVLSWLQPPAEPGVLTEVARWLLPLLLLGLVTLVWRSARYRPLRQAVGILWDVLTFWPRRFHPLAVRPSTERAVPEVRARLEQSIGAQDGMLLSVHSQGSVLGVAALLAMEDEQVQRVGLLTYGCPLTTLYAPVFPAYLGGELLEGLRARLDDGAAGWVNLWRRTDPIGGEVFPGQDPTTATDIECPDPATGPPSRDLPTDTLDPEPLRRAWTELRSHSYFYREQAYKDAVGRLRGALAADEQIVAEDTGGA